MIQKPGDRARMSDQKLLAELLKLKKAAASTGPVTIPMAVLEAAIDCVWRMTELG
jgi:hypothetical protein